MAPDDLTRDARQPEAKNGIPPGPTAPVGPVPDRVAAGTVIGPYQLLEQIGEGGMGEVWLAEQREPVRRRVAIKVIKLGMDTREVIGRFASERQALALMAHPAITKVFDAGTTPDGRPWFVMEYVAGLPITSYCDRHRLDIRHRLRLFIAVCDGVQHAHQKAIIHRDLKPPNILVTEVDGKPVPRIIDFGVAKATAQRLHTDTLHTRTGALIGTLGYISPEQAGSDGADIDTRSDVYSLGVVLCELLSGALPFDFRKLAYDQVLRCLREEDAPLPSARLRAQGEDAVLTATNRSTDPATLLRLLQGDLDAIVLRALEKERSRRYASPLDLAADIGRYLRNEPVAARPPSALYRARKYIRRHGLSVAMISLLVVLAVAFALAQTVELRRLRRERDRADRMTEFLTNMYKVPAPSEARGNTVTAREILDRSSEDIERGLDKDIVLRAQLMLVMAKTYENLGLYSRAHTLMEQVLRDRRRTLGDHHPKTLDAMAQMGWILYREGRDAEAERLLRTTIAAQNRSLGTSHPSTLESKDHLARILLRQAHFAEALTLEQDLVATSTRSQGAENPQTLRFMDGLAIAFARQSRFKEAETEYRRLLDLERHSLGTDHPDTLETMHHLATMYLDQGRYGEAEILYRDTLQIDQRVLGPEHPDTANAMTTLANTIRFDPRRYAEAENLYRKSLAIELRAPGPDHPYTTRTQEGLANLLSEEEHYTEAEGLLRQILDTRRRLLGADHTDTLLSQYNLATVFRHERRYGDAEKLVRSTLSAQSRVLDASDPDTFASRALLADLLLDQRKPAEAEALARQAFDDRLRTLGPHHRDTLESLGSLGTALVGNGRYEEAKKFYLDTIHSMGSGSAETGSADLSATWYNLACMASRAGRRDEAFGFLNHAVDAGYSDVRLMSADADLRPLRTDPRFDKLVAKMNTAGSPLRRQ